MVEYDLAASERMHLDLVFKADQGDGFAKILVLRRQYVGGQEWIVGRGRCAGSKHEIRDAFAKYA
jgi:hypothetical protein